MENKNLCFEYNKNIEIYLERKKTFRENKVKYFFNPNALLNEFTVPHTYNKIVDDVFKSLKRDTVSKNRHEMALRYKDLIKSNFQKKVIKPQVLDEKKLTSKEDRRFFYDYEWNYSMFDKKISLFEKITNNYDNLKIFSNEYKKIDEAFYLYHENDMNGIGLKDTLQEIGANNKVACYYAQYELIRWEVEQEIDC